MVARTFSLSLMILTMFGLLSTPAIGRKVARNQPVESAIARCYSANGSNAGKSACLARLASKAKAAVAVSFSQLKAADAKSIMADYKHYDPRPEMDDAQRAWSKWMVSECEMRADLPRGSVAATILPECELRLATERRAQLDAVRRENY